MTPEIVVCTRLASLSTVVAVVGARIFAGVAAQGTARPFVFVQAISDVRGQHLRGPNAYHQARVQVDCVADTFDGANALAAVVRGDGLGTSASGLWGWTGDLGGSPALAHVHNIEYRTSRPMYVAEDVRQFRVMQEYLLHWRPVI